MKIKPLMLAVMGAVVLCCGPAAFPVSAQPSAPPPMPDYQLLSDQQLDQLLGPIALYPDPLLAQLLPATTLPTQIVLADRYVNAGGDPGQIDQQPWDASVQAMAHYPSVLQYLDDNLDWTTELGQAFLNQQQEVMDSIQRLRISARNYGNLVSTPQQQVVDDNGYIEILPAEPDTVYVPVYEPGSVYSLGGFALGFGTGFSLGGWLNCDFDWHQHQLYFWDRNHGRPANWWHQRPDQRTAWMARQGTVWRTEDHRAASAANRGDRGWDRPAQARPVHGSLPVVNGPKPSAVPRPAAAPRPAQAPRPDQAPRPTAVPSPGAFHAPERPAPAPVIRAPSNGAFIGGESAQAARTFSDRGQESLRSANPPEPAHSLPASHPAPASGGGGAHAAGSPPRH